MLMPRDAPTRLLFRLLLLCALVHPLHANRPRHPHRQHQRQCSKYGNCTTTSPAEWSAAGDELPERPPPHYEVSRTRPVYAIFPLPTVEHVLYNPHRIVLDKVRPVVDLALEDVYFLHRLLENGSIVASFEDTRLSDAHGPKRRYQAPRYGFVYGLAPVARMSPFWRDADSDGIPVITSTGLASNLDRRDEYALMTRISAPYKLIGRFVYLLWLKMKWKRVYYIFQPHPDGYAHLMRDGPFGECHFQAGAVQHRLGQFFETATHVHDPIHDKMTRAELGIRLRQASMVSNAQQTTAVQRRTSNRWPHDVLVILPAKESHNDKFGLTIAKAMPVVDIAVEDVVRFGLVPPGWIRLRFEDSRFWEDATLAERHAVNAVVRAHCEGRLDAVLGFADAYALATVAKVSAGFGEGIPVITTTGLNSQLGYKRSFPYLVRMQGSYRQIAQSMFRLLAYNEDDEEKSTSLNYRNFVFFYHDKRRAVNKPEGSGNGEDGSELTSSECYFTLYSTKNYFVERSQYFKSAWISQASHVAFDEELNHTRADIHEWLKKAAASANGGADGQHLDHRNARLPQRSYRTFPLDIVVGLPDDEGSVLRNPFRLTIGKSQPVFDVALEDIERRQMLPSGALRVTYEDTELSDAVGPQKFVDRYCQRTIDAAFGFAYVFVIAPVARMSQFWGSGVPVLTTSAMVDELGDRQIFPLLTRLMGTYRTLCQDGPPDGPGQAKNWKTFHFPFHGPSSSSSARLRTPCARSCSQAYDLGMAQSGEYVFINIDVSTGSVAEKPWLRMNATNAEESVAENRHAREAYRALKTISLRRSDLEEYKNFETRVKERAEKKYNYSQIAKKEYEMNNFISAFYDAVLLYAIALNETLAEGLDPRNGRNITSKMWNRTFVGVGGLRVSIDHNGDRFSDYSLLDLDPEKDRFVEVAYYSGASNELKQMTDFHWVNGKPPKDSPVCGFDHSKCPEGYPPHVYALIGAAVIICVLGFGFCIVYRFVPPLLSPSSFSARPEGTNSSPSLAAMSWRIRWEELEGGERDKKEKKHQKRARKSDIYSQVEQTEALLRSNSRSSIGSDKFGDEDSSILAMRMRLRSSSSGATRKISAMIDRKLSVFTRKKSTPFGRKASQREQPHGRRELEDGKNFEAFRSGGSVETIAMQHNAQIFTRTASYRGTMVAIKDLHINDKRYPKLELSRKLLLEFKQLKDLQHDHITRFAGACVDPPHYCIVTEYCPKGSLEDILENEKIQLDRMMKYSLLHDLVKGCYFLHNSEVKFHGRLKTSNCVVDGRFVLKVTDFGLLDLRAMEEVTPEEDGEPRFYRKLLWTAPEILRKANPFLTNVPEVLAANKADTKMMQKADLYSFALILHEVLFRRGAFYRGEEENVESKDIVFNVKAVPKNEDELYRPLIVADLEEEAQNENAPPPHRPDDNETSNLVDNLLKRMEQYATNLEGLVEERTQEYLAEKKKVEELLHQLLPPTVADQLMSGHAVEPESFEAVTIYFSDIVGFTSLSSSSTPMQIVTLLNDLYSAFDGVVDNFKVYKVETIGDAYMVVSGLPERREDHASQIAQIRPSLHKVKNFTIKHRPNEQLKLRIGMHSGSVAAGVVGSKMPRYCLFGDTVNMASRMESTGLPLRIHVSTDTHAILSADEGFHMTCRGQIQVKGKGQQTTYWLKGYKHVQIPDFGPEFADD
ncbi:Guanylate cyclase [Aphelenchoides fujianensis]|nr:Guanylate cyclase [Aphelenchoides fujianensis]